MAQQYREQRSLPPAGDLHQLTVAADLQRSKNPELQAIAQRCLRSHPRQLCRSGSLPYQRRFDQWQPEIWILKPD